MEHLKIQRIFKTIDDGSLLYKATLKNANTENSDKTGEGEGLSLLVGTANAVINSRVSYEIYVNDIDDSDTFHFKKTYNLKDETTGVTHTLTKSSSGDDSAYSNQVTMGPAIILKTGSSSAIQYEIDYVYVCQKR